MKKVLLMLGALASTYCYAESTQCTGRLERNTAVIRTAVDFVKTIDFSVDSGSDARSKCDACMRAIREMIANKSFDKKAVFIISNGWDGPMGTVLKSFLMTSELSSNYNFRVQFFIPGKEHNYYCSEGLKNDDYNVPLHY